MSNPLRHPAEDAVSIRVPLTPRQTEVMAEYVIHGDRAEGARCMGIAYSTFINHVTDIHHRTDQETTLGALRVLGWLHVPVSV